MTALLNVVHGWGPLSIFLRLFFAMAVGVLIGINRELKNRSAGIKTHVLVCIGAALAMMTSEYILHMFPDARADVNRIGAQVISGVGFLGVGTIIVTGRKQVRGLTTAAGLWACACVGIAIGIGFVEGTVIATGFILFTLWVLDYFDRQFHQHTKYLDIYMEFISNMGIEEFLIFCRKHGIRVDHFNISESHLTGEGPCATFSATLRTPEIREAFFEHVHDNDNIKYYEVL
ncbi:MAG: MgtC/SapB family protein [Lachnospiraceae bacterium]|nr:MgtC/SapB family protein [Lachnospiraceae bacterium]